MVNQPICMQDWLARTARDKGERLALVAPDRSLTYAELDAQATALAARLRASGVDRNQPVALVAEPSSDMIVGILGILKAGGAYVPLDPAYPAGLVRHVLADTAASVVVSQPALADRLRELPAQIVTIAPEPAPAAAPGHCIGGSPDDLAYILYTSGSSGRPKGVPITHRNLVHSTEARQRVYGEAPDSFLLLSSVTFDSSIAGIFWTLAGGGTLVVPPRRLEQDLAALLALVRAQRVTHTLCLPTLYGLILRAAAPADLASLRTVIVAGEACPAALVRAHHQSLPAVRLCNEYGPTEATVWSTVQVLEPKDAAEPMPIGRPIPRMRAYVLDAERRPLPAGVVGELWLAGAGLTSGYLNLEALNAERFAAIDVPGERERAYRTGDLAAWRADGTLVFLGRADAQLKLRGHRIEPAGIEAVLREHPDIADAAVTLRGTPTRLVAYVVSAAGAELDPAVLRDRLKAEFADAHVPDRIVQLQTLPRTWSGKVDYKALPEPALPAVAAFDAPRSAVEATLVAIWSDVLGIPRIGIHENYFALGGDSILSIQIVSRIRAAGLAVDPRHVLERPTIAELAAAVGETAGNAAASAPVSGEVPLAPSQAWLLQRGLQAPHHWNHSALFEVPGDLGVDRLRRSLACLLAEHDQLRARFEKTKSGQWRQIVVPAGSVAVPLEIVELDKETGTVLEAVIAERLRATQSSLDLDRAPLLRALLLRFGPHRPAQLLLAVHHLVVDAVSWSLLIEDLEEAYAQTATRLQPRLRPRTASFRDWALGLERDPRVFADRQQVQAWCRVLEADADDPPCDRPVVAAPTETAAQVLRRELPAELGDSLLARANERYETRPEELLLAALTLAIGTQEGHASLRLIREGHGREGDLDLTHTVGWFTAMTPLALRIATPADPAAVIVSVREQVRATPAPAHSYGLLRWGGHDPEGARLLERAGDPTLLFNFLGRRPSNRERSVFRRLSGAEATARDPRNARSHLLEINAAIVDGLPVIDWIYCDPVHSRDTIEGWARRFEHELERLVDHCLATEPGKATRRAFADAELDEAELDSLMARLARR